jgi:hypothetical protein
MAKKPSARRATAKKPRAGRVSGKTTARADRYPPEARFTILAKENPRRPKTGQHARFEVLKKFSGKRVADLPEKDHTGLVMALRYAAEQGHARVASK